MNVAFFGPTLPMPVKSGVSAIINLKKINTLLIQSRTHTPSLEITRIWLRMAVLFLFFCCLLCSNAAWAVNAWQRTGGPSFETTSLAIDPVDPSKIYAGTRAGGIFKSIDGGTSWSPALNGLGGSEIRAIAVDATESSNVFAATNQDLFKSVDAGLNWSAVVSPLTGRDVLSLAIDPTRSSTLYAGIWGFAAVFKSVDSGASWVQSNTGMNSVPGVFSILIDKATPTTLYAGTLGSGVFKSTDGGATWISRSAGINQEIMSLAMDPWSPLTLYAGTADGVYKTVDGAMSWTPAGSFQADSLRVLGIVINPTLPSTLYAIKINSVFKSTDGGSHWARANSGVGVIRANTIAIDPTDPSKLYLGSNGSETVLKSTNGAVSSDAHLISLDITSTSGPLGLTPTFTNSFTSYTSTTSDSFVTVKPSLWIDDATVTVNGATVAIGSTSEPLQLAAGVNTIDIRVTSGDGSATNTYAVSVTRTAEPSVPEGVSATPGAPGSGQISVNWSAPADNGSAITSYTVTGSPSGTCTVMAPATACTLNTLPNATQYSFSVTATNGVGQGPASEISNGVWLQGAQTISFANPGAQNYGTAPTVTATGGASGQAVVFSLSGVCTVSAGGVLSFSGAGSCSVTANQAGTSAYAAASPVMHTFTVNPIAPGSPTPGAVVAGDGRATVNWTAPTSNGGSALTGYGVMAVQDNTKFCTAASADTSCTVVGLANGTSYTFAITATNGASLTGSASITASPATPRAPQTISFSTLPPQSFGATAPTLSATATSGLAVAFSSTTPTVCTVAGTAITLLDVGTCTIEATQHGDAAFLAATPVQQGFTVNPVVPGVPTAVQATAGDAQATVSWTAPSFVGSSALIGYRAEVVGDSTKFCAPAAPSTGTSCSINGLANGTSYTFQVFATNGAGNSAASAASTSVTPQAPASGGGGGGGSTPPTGGAITVPTNGSATLGGAGSATLGTGATLTVQPQAAGSPISPPATGTANVVLGAAGGSVTLGQPVGTTNGQAVVLSPEPGQSAPVLGLQSGSVVVGSSTPGQVLLDIGTTGTGGVASGQQVVAGPNGARIEARRDANGSTTVQVLEGSAVVPCGAPCPQATNGAPAPTITLLQGEVATIDAQGTVRQVNVSTPALQPQPAPTGIVLPAALPSLTGTPPARTPGQTLLEQARVGLQALLGQPLASKGQQALGNAIWALEGGLSLGLMPLGPPQVDLTLPNGASLTPDGTLGIVYQGVVQRFGPAPVDLQATGEALRAVLPQAQMRIADTGSWWVESVGGTGGGTPLALRPGWLAQQGAPLQPPAPRFETDAAGQLWLAQANGLRTPLYPALAEPAGLQALLSAADAQATLQVQLDGTAVARLYRQNYRLQPLPVLQPVQAQHAGQTLWLEVSQGQLLLWVRVGVDGRWAQAMVVSAIP